MQEPFPNFPTEPPQKPAGEPLPPQEETPAPPTEQPVPPVQSPLPPVQNTPQNNPVPPVQNPLPPVQNTPQNNPVPPVQNPLPPVQNTPQNNPIPPMQNPLPPVQGMPQNNPIPPMQNPIPNWYQNQQPTMGNWQIPPQVPPAPPQKQPLTPEQKDRRTAFWLKIVAALLAALLLYCIGSDVVSYRRGGAAPAADKDETAGSKVIIQQQDKPELDKNAENTDADGAYTVEGVASVVCPSIVEIETYGDAKGEQLSGTGSGIISSEDGYIITNNHVVSGASQVTVRTSDGTEYPATVVGADSKTDIAVLKIEATGLTPAVVGDSDSLQVGEFTLAVGNPLGELGGTVTDGIISALDREVTVENQTMNLLQTNAAVSPGNSGGGLFNERGELIGIVNAKSSGQNAEGLGFAIPVNTAIQVAEELINNGYVTGRPAMGVTVLSINDAQTAFQYGVNQAGVYVQSVNEGGAADKAGLQPGDRFVSIDGTAVNSTSDITGIIGEHAVGDTIEVQVVRGTQIVTANVTLEESTPQASSTQRTEG